MMVDLRHYSVSFGKERACYAKAPAFVSFRLVMKRGEGGRTSKKDAEERVQAVLPTEKGLATQVLPQTKTA